MRKGTFVALMALICGGCSFQASCGKKTVKTAELETNIKAWTAEMGVEATSVTCPKNIEAKVGAVFTCDVTIAEKAHALEVTITEVDGSRFNTSLAWKEGVAVAASKIEAGASRGLTDTLGVAATVECGDGLLFVENSSLRCQLQAGGVETGLTIEFDDNHDAKGWKTDDMLFSRAKLEQTLTPSVKQQTNPNVEVHCGDAEMIKRPADGIVWCDIGDGKEAAKIRVTTDEDAKLKGWEVAQP